MSHLKSLQDPGLMTHGNRVLKHFPATLTYAAGSLANFFKCNIRR